VTEQTSYHETEGIAASKRRMAAHENTAIQTVHGIDLTFENALRAATDRNRNAIRGGIHVPRDILLHLVAQQRLLQSGLVKPDDNRPKVRSNGS
jgi:hypothetical protein